MSESELIQEVESTPCEARQVAEVVPLVAVGGARLVCGRTWGRGFLRDGGRKLVESPYKESVDWLKWLIFWVDERVVPFDSEDSNYLLDSRGFLSKEWTTLT